MILASPNPALFCAGADIKAFTKWTRRPGASTSTASHALVRDVGAVAGSMTIAAVNGLALGGGCEIAMACDVRLAGGSASFGQPEINLGIIPGFGGTQRLPRLVGPAKALEMNTHGEPISAEDAYEYGLVNRVVPDHELFDTALAWARKFAGQAPLALEQIKQVSHTGDLDEGIAAESDAFTEGVRVRGRARGHRRVPREADAGVQGEVSVGPRRAGRADPLGRLGRRADGRRDLRAVRDPGLPHAGHRAVGERRPDGGRPHRRLPARPGALLVLLRPALRDAATSKQPNGAHLALAELERRGLLAGVITQNIDGLHAAAGTADLIEVHGSISHASCLRVRRRVRAGGDAGAAGRRRGRRAALRLRRIR